MVLIAMESQREDTSSWVPVKRTNRLIAQNNVSIASASPSSVFDKCLTSLHNGFFPKTAT